MKLFFNRNKNYKQNMHNVYDNLFTLTNTKCIHTHTQNTKYTLLLQNKFTKTQRKPIDERARMRFCRVKIDGN